MQDTKIIEIGQRLKVIIQNKMYWTIKEIVERTKARGNPVTIGTVRSTIYQTGGKNISAIEAAEEVIKIKKQISERDPIALKSKKQLWVEMKTEEVNFILDNQSIQL